MPTETYLKQKTMSYNTFTLPNGLRIIHAPNQSNVAYCGFAVDAGTRDENEQEQGMAHFVEHLIFKGTQKRHAWHILNRMENVGGDLNAYTNKEETVIYSAFLVEHFSRAAELLADIVFHSTFPQHEIDKEVEVIIDEIHRKKGKLVTTGMGKAGQIAMNIATTFCSTGIPAVFLHPSEAQHGDLGILQENDLLLLISNSGKTREIVELTQLAHNLNPNLKYIVITGNADSPLARESDICLCTGHPDEVCALGMTPTTSTTVMTVIGDILVVETMKRTGFTIEEYSKRHHGGYLGERSRELSK